jgi:hypothetical protein
MRSSSPATWGSASSMEGAERGRAQSARSPTSILSRRSSATASGSENVVRSTRALGLRLAMCAARCRATTSTWGRADRTARC